MGQCTSSKSGKIHLFYKKKKNKHLSLFPSDNKMEKAGVGKKITRGQATSFGFRKATPEPPASKKTSQEQCNSFGFRKPTSAKQANPFSANKNVKPEPVSVKKTEQPAVTVQETIQPLLIAPVRPKSQNSCGARPKETKPANRFGFRGPQLSNKVADVDASSSHSLEPGQPEPRKYRLEWNQSNGARNQCAARLPVAAGYSAEADKRAKTAANTALSTVHADSVIEIQQLDHSPSMTNKFRQTQHQLQLQHELNLQQLREEQIQQQMAYSLNVETSDEGFETSTEEKQIRDKEANEKDVLRSGEQSPSEAMWGRGEALCDEELCSSFAHIDKSPETLPLRSVLLKIEDTTFAPLAALSQSALLEDETLPDSPDLSCSSAHSIDPLPPPPLMLTTKDSPGSPGTPTNSSSGSDTRDRDFLIDDEIADQPGLVFDNRVGHRLVDTTRKIQKLADEVSEALASVNPRLTGSRQSVSTLSPCDSLTSDDLMADFDTSDFDELDDAALKSELQNQSTQVMREWSSLLTSHPGLKSGRRKSRLSGGSTSSGGGGVLDVPQSIASPNRTSKKVVSASSACEDGSDESPVRVDRDTYQLIFQDVISIKSMLVRLQRTLQDEASTVTSQTEDQGEESADLRRQIVLLRAQLEEEERKRMKAEEELHKVRPQPQGQSVRSSVNKATQTDRIRPVSTSQALFQTSPDNSSSSFVSFQLGKTYYLFE